MSISNKSLKDILKKLNYSDDKIKEVMDSEEEVDIQIPDGVRVYDADGYDELIENVREEAKREYIKAGKRIAIKELKEADGLEYEGKDADAYREAYKAKVLKEAEIPANEAIEQYKQEKTQLQSKIEQLTSALSEKDSALNGIRRDSDWLSSFPSERKKDMSDDDRLLLFKNKVEYHETDDAKYFTYKGKRLQDDKANDLSKEDVFSHVFKSEGWIAEEEPTRAGRGGASTVVSSSKSPKTLSEAKAHWESEGKTPMGAQFQAYVGALKRENDDFDLRS